MVTKNGEFDISRKKVSNRYTLSFIKDMKELDALGIGLTMKKMSKLLCVSYNSLRRWEEAELIFPIEQKTKKYKCKKYRYKDVLRGFTIKYLMSEMGFTRLIGVKLLLEMTNQAITSKDEPQGTINNYRIDKYLMKILDYDVNTTALNKPYCRVLRKDKDKEKNDDSTK